ncbi:sugar ABC transporter substrate-binding protein [Mesorhizobium sp. M2C.T.Ca.TU.009.01.2.1]|nr:sugar ABC transporter substrate-binding protein [Mesorhizobium sp. M2C.T.Ca.TU.009.01.2.1]
MTKKKYLLFATAALAASVCAGPGNAAEKSVALVLGVKGSPFYQALACGAKAKAKELGLDLTVSAPDQFAADSQVPVVNAVTATGPAVAAIVPTDMQALIAPMKQLSDRGTKVITIDQTIGDSSFVQTQILTDNEAGGKLGADAMNTLLGGKGKVLVITQPPGSAAQDARTTGFEEELKKYPGIEYLGPQYQSDDPQKAAEIITSTLSAHPDLAGVFSTNDQGAIGAITGLKQAGAAGKVKVVAYDAATAEVNAFKNGTIHALIAQNPKQEGEVAMEAAAKLIGGGSLDKTTLTEIVTIKAGDTAAAEKYEYKGDCE